MADATRLRRPTTATLTVLTGARAGHCHRLVAEFATLGQAPAADLTFDPVRDPAVALRHAAVFRHGGGYVIRDLGSTVGTWVNGARVRGEMGLEPGDRIQLGPEGPEVEFAIMAVEDAAAAASVPEVAPPLPGGGTRARHQPPVTGATDLSRQLEVVQHTDRLRRRLAITMLVILAAVAGATSWVAWARTQQRQALERERDRVLARVDSVQSLLSVAREQAEGLRPVLDTLEQDVAAQRATLTASLPTAAATATVEATLEATMARSVPVLEAARFDPGLVLADHGNAVVTVRVRLPDGEQRLVGGLLVAARGDTAWAITLRDAVVGQDGIPHDSLGVLLSRGRSARRTRVVATDVPAGLAVLRLVPGPVARLATPLADSGATVGTAVAVVGLPSGISLPEGSEWRRSVPPVSAVPATITSAGTNGLTLDLYGAERGNANVVFDGSGRLLGLTTPSLGLGARDVRVIPSSRLAALLRRVTSPSP